MTEKKRPPFGLHIPKRGTTWVYQFIVDGVRYSRSTRKTGLSEAIKIASKAHGIAVGDLPAIVRDELKPEMTLDLAFDRYYQERASHLKSANDLLSILARMSERLGPNTLLSRLTFNDLARYQVERKKDGVSNRTINYEIPQTIRPVVKRARKWGINCGALGGFTSEEWRELSLPLPAHRSRTASRHEQAKLLWSLRKDYRPIIRFALMSGLRRAALLVKKEHVDWQAGYLGYEKKSHLVGDATVLPLTDAMLSLLRHAASQTGPDCEYVFTYVCKVAGNGKRAGRRYPINYEGLSNEMRKAVKKAGLKDWRLLHDLRHTAATETLRATQNLAVVQKMLGHTNISQTSRYAHVLMEDVRAAMNKRKRPT